MKTGELTLYRDLVGDIKSRVSQAQHRAALPADLASSLPSIETLEAELSQDLPSFGRCWGRCAADGREL
jgi:hypothetical protein